MKKIRFDLTEKNISLFKCKPSIVNKIYSYLQKDLTLTEGNLLNMCGFISLRFNGEGQSVTIKVRQYEGELILFVDEVEIELTRNMSTQISVYEVDSYSGNIMKGNERNV